MAGRARPTATALMALMALSALMALIAPAGCGQESERTGADGAPAPRAETGGTPSPADEPPSGASDGPPAPETTGGLEVTAIGLPYEGGSLAAGRDAVWSVPHKDQVALRIDPRTAEVTDEIELPGVGAELAADRRMIWASVSRPENFEPDGLVRIDPERLEVSAHVDIPAVFPQIHGGRVWAAGEDGRLYSIDPATNRVTDRFATGGKGGFRFALAGRHAWVTRLDRLRRIDTRTGASEDFSRLLRGRRKLYEGHERLVPTVTAGGLLWAVGADELVGLDPETGAVAAEVPAPSDVELLPDAVRHRGDVWVLGMGDDALLHVIGIDARRRRLADRFGIETFPELGFAAGHGHLWLPAAASPVAYRLDVGA